MLCSDLLSSFPRDFLLLPRSGVLRDTVFYSSSLRFFCWLSRFLSRVVLSSFLEGRSGLGLMSSVLPWVLWTLLLALGRFVLLSLPGPLAVQLRYFFFSLHVVQTEPWSFFIAKKPLVVRRLFCSWDFLLVLRHLVSSIPEPVGSWERFFILSFLRLRVPFYSLFGQLAAIGVLFVVFLLVVA